MIRIELLFRFRLSKIDVLESYLTFFHGLFVLSILIGPWVGSRGAVDVTLNFESGIKSSGEKTRL